LEKWILDNDIEMQSHNLEVLELRLGWAWLWSIDGIREWLAIKRKS